ncbi:T9SS type A sorting domain-containing protein, partial [Hymenobacter agri]
LPITGTTAVFLNGAAPTSTSGTVATYADGSTYDSSTGAVAFATTAAAQATGGSVSNTVTYSVPNNGNATLVNTARVRSATTDTNAANNAASVLTTILPVSDIQVVLTGPGSATLASAAQGTSLTYGVLTTNNGPSVAGSVTTTVQLPSGLSDVVVRGYDGTVLTNSATTGYNSSTGVVTFPAVTNQPSGATYASAGSLSFTSPAGVYALAPTATATISTPATEPNLANNTATVVTTLNAPTAASVDLSVSIARNASTAATVAAGSPAVFDVTTSNAGTSTASASAGAVTTVQLPAGLATIGTVTLSSGGTYDNTTGLVTFTSTSALAIGGSTLNTITISAAPGQGPLVATAAVRGVESDPISANNYATTSVGINSVVDVATTVAGPAVAITGSSVSYSVMTTNNGPSSATTVAQTVTLPVGIVSYSLNGGAAVVLNGGSATTTTTTVTLPVPATLPAGPNNTVTNSVVFNAPASTTSNFPYTVPANVSAGNETGTTTNNTASITTTRYALPPVATDVTNTLQAPQANTAAVALPISPLAATSAASTIGGYTLVTVPTIGQGVLSYNNGGTYTTAAAGQVLTPTQAASLRFLPASGYVGNASFTYTATDATNLVSGNVATYLLPVGTDNAAVAAGTTPKGGSNHYLTNDILTYVVDSNGAQYTNGGATAGIVYDATTGTLQSGAANGLPVSGTNAVLATTGPSGNATNALPSGVSLNATTGQLFVSNASLLPRINANTTYSVNVVVTDIYGGVSTVTESFTLGAYPLPVQLAAFAAVAVQQDARLNWRTASEINNDHFEVERSFDGLNYAQIGRVAGHGNSATPHDYQLTDAGVGGQARGAVYYRLRQVDADGTATFSPVRTVSFAPLTGLALYPNPASSATTLDLRSLPLNTAYSVVVLDATGRVVLRQTLSGGQAQPLNLTQLATGTYLVQVGGNGLHLTKRLTIE